MTGREVTSPIYEFCLEPALAWEKVSTYVGQGSARYYPWAKANPWPILYTLS